MKTDRTTLKRLPNRGSHDRESIDAILDAGIICHVAFNIDGQPCIIPTSYVRIGDDVYIHGSAASRMLRQLSGGMPMSLAVTHLDGMVLARSGFHHSMNYRSVILYGEASLVSEAAEKKTALDALVEHLVPGRTRDARGASELELKATTVLRIPITEGSAKVRTGPPADEPEDMDLGIWAGVIPLRYETGPLETDPLLEPGIEPPDYVVGFRPPGEPRD